MSAPKDAFESINPDHLATVAGGARTSSSGSSELTAMLTQITSSIKDLASSKNTGSDPMQMIMMMMMMGGMGGGGGGGGSFPGHGAPVINIDTAVSGGGGRRPRGKKGW